jgi:predicted transcriptional regulator
MKELTKAEEQVMQIMWELGKTSVKDVVDKMAEPRPAYNTVSTIVRILEKKGFIDHEPFGKGYLYYPIVEKKDYTRSYMKNLVSNYFNGSFKELVSFFVREDKIDMAEMEAILKELNNDSPSKSE